MRRIALFSLLHEPGKAMAAALGVALATTLVLLQGGMYAGFLDSSTALVHNVGGDVWVMARGTEVVDEGETLSPGAVQKAAQHPCVVRARGMILGWGAVRKANGALGSVQVVAVEDGPLPVPWSTARGLPSDLRAPMRAAIDDQDLEKLQIQGDPLGASLEIGGLTLHVALLTHGIRSFSLMPYVFTSVTSARRIMGLGDGRFTYVVLDLKSPSCAASVAETIDRQPDLTALTTAVFARKSEDYWVGGSGAGTALAFGAVLGLIVGVAVVGQTLHSVAKGHLVELATLKALGAKRSSLAGFVTWQATLLCGGGAAFGLALSLLLADVVSNLGVKVILTPAVVAPGLLAIVAMCVLASVGSVLQVLRVDVAEVFR